RSRDFIHWETSDGRALGLPITLDTGEVIDPAKPRQGLINMTFNLGFDTANRPVVVYHRYDEGGKSQAYVARPAAAQAPWQITQVSAWDFRWQFGGGGSLNAEVQLGAPRLSGADASLAIDYLNPAGKGRWLLDSRTLATLRTIPPPAPILPAALQTTRAATPGMEVQTIQTRHAGRRWVLRWETLPRNRDLPRKETPPPTELRLY